MLTPQTPTAPGGLGVDAPSGGCCEPTHHQKGKFISTINPPTDQEQQRFTGDHDRGDDDFFAVAQALAAIFHMTIGPFVEHSDEEAGQ